MKSYTSASSCVYLCRNMVQIVGWPQWWSFTDVINNKEYIFAKKSVKEKKNWFDFHMHCQKLGIVLESISNTKYLLLKDIVQWKKNPARFGWFLKVDNWLWKSDFGTFWQPAHLKVGESEMKHMGKVHEFWEGHNFYEISTIDLSYVVTNGQIYGIDFRKILWPSQNIWTLFVLFLQKSTACSKLSHCTGVTLLIRNSIFILVTFLL